MSHTHSIHLKRAADFRQAYRLLKRHGLLKTTPIILSEGDSWFSTPLSMNLLDQLVFPTPEDERERKVIFGKGGLFYRKEKSGDTAINMFKSSKVKHLAKWIGSDLYKFDLVLISAGGNDFVADFLERLFKNKGEMTVEQGIQLVIDSGQYEKVYRAYERFLKAAIQANPTIPIIAHTYDYPQVMGQEGRLTIGNIGAIAFFKKKVGDWIGKNIEHSIKSEANQKEFAKQLLDNFKTKVLEPLVDDDRFKHNFSFVDLTKTLKEKSLWFDEMHPTSQGFYKLAQKLKEPILSKLSLDKRH